MAGQLAGLIKYIHRTEWADELKDVLLTHMEPACELYDLRPEESVEFIGEHAANTLWGCALEDLMSRIDEDGRNVVDEYLKKRGYAESGGNKRYMKALRNSVLSVYEVSDVVPGQSFMARDLVRGGEPVRILERSATQSLKQWERISARVVFEGRDHRMSGGVLVFNRKAADELVAELKLLETDWPKRLRAIAESEKIPIDPQIEALVGEISALPHAASMISTFWLTDTLDRVLNPQLPILENADGEALVICESEFRLTASTDRHALAEAIAALPGMERSSARQIDWLGRTDKSQPEKQPQNGNERRIAINSSRQDGVPILGNIQIKRNRIILFTNSRERAAIGEAMLAESAGSLIGAVSRKETRGADAMLGLGRSRRSRRKVKEKEPEISPEDAKAIVHTYLNQHYRKVIDEKVPALGNKSPREAAQSAESRGELINWLKDMENHALRDRDSPMASYDFRWIWQELGVQSLRA